MEEDDGQFIPKNLIEEDVELINCDICGRHFRSDVLVKHEPICIKNSKKKRKVFNSGKQRAEGSDIPINKILKPGEIPKSDPKLALAEAKTKNWREKHNILVESLRAARDYAKAKNSGLPLPPPPPTVVDSSLVQCPYCQRRFNEESSKRHIAFCKEHQAKTAPRTTKKVLVGGSGDVTDSPPSKTPMSAVKSGSANSARGPRTLAQSTVHRTNTRNGDLPASRVAKSNVPRNMTVTVTPPPPTLLTTNTKSRITTTRPGVSGIGKLSSLPRLPRPTSNTMHHTTTVVSTSGSVLSTVSGGDCCHECGYVYPVPTARFCCDCGVRRL